MSRYILDTDHVSLILCNHPQVTVNASLHQIAVTVITVQELFNGWIGRINDPSAVHNLPALYSKLWTTVKYLQTVEILDFTPLADDCLKHLLKKNPPLRKNRLQKDMRIAAIAKRCCVRPWRLPLGEAQIALSLNATVVTRNQRDFGLVPSKRDRRLDAVTTGTG